MANGIIFIQNGVRLTDESKLDVSVPFARIGPDGRSSFIAPEDVGAPTVQAPRERREDFEDPDTPVSRPAPQPPRERFEDFEDSDAPVVPPPPDLTPALAPPPIPDEPFITTESIQNTFEAATDRIVDEANRELGVRWTLGDAARAVIQGQGVTSTPQEKFEFTQSLRLATGRATLMQIVAAAYAHLVFTDPITGVSDDSLQKEFLAIAFGTAEQLGTDSVFQLERLVCAGLEGEAELFGRLLVDFVGKADPTVGAELGEFYERIGLLSASNRGVAAPSLIHKRLLSCMRVALFAICPLIHWHRPCWLHGMI